MKYTFLFSLLFAPAAAIAQQAEGGSVFVNGFARITKGGQTWYIDTAGNKAFDTATALTGPGAGKQLVKKGGRYGILGRNGRWLLPPEFDEIDTQWSDIWKVKKNGKQSWSDSTGRLLLPLQFEEAGYLDGHYFDVKHNGKWGVYNGAAKQWVIPAEYEGFDYCGGCGQKGNYLMAGKNGKWGVIDFNRKQLAPFVYDHSHSRMRSDNWVTSFTRNNKPVMLNLANGKEYPAGEVLGNGLMVYRKQGGVGMVNDQGLEVLPPVYEDIASPDPQFSTVTAYVTIQQKEHWGLADTSGRVLIKPLYSEMLTTVFDSLFITQRNGLDVLLNARGQSLLPDGCTSLEIIRRAAAAVFRRNGKYGVYHAATGRTTPAVYDEINEQYYGSEWLQSCVIIVKNGWSGLLGPDGTEVVPPRFDAEFSTTTEAARQVVVRKGDKRGLYSERGRELAPAKYDAFYPDPHDPSLLRVTMEVGDSTLTGIIDTAGAAVYPIACDEIIRVNDSLVLLSKGSEQLVMNTVTKNAYVLPNVEAAIIVSPQVLSVKKPGGWHLYNLQKRELITPAYDYMNWFNSAAALVTGNNKMGMIQPDGKVILPLEYEFGTNVSTGVVLIGKGSKYGFADSTGKVIVPMQYDYSTAAYAPDYQRGRHLLLNRRNEAGHYLAGVADLSGRVLLEPVYEKVLFDEDNKGFLVFKDGKFGLALADGRLAVPVEYDDVVPLSLNRYISTFTFSWPLLCRKDDAFVYIDRNGKPLPVQIKEVMAYTRDFGY